MKTYNRKQVWLPVATKANAAEVGADVKDSSLCADAGHLEDGGLMSQSPSLPSWSMQGFL